MNLVRKYKICKILNDFSSLTKRELEIIEFMLHWFPLNKFIPDTKIFINETPSYYYNSKRKAVFFDFTNIQMPLEVDLSLSYNDVQNLIKSWFEEIHSVEVDETIQHFNLHNLPLDY